MNQKMPDELFRAMHSHNSAPNSDIARHTPHFYPHLGAGHKGIKPLMCKHDVVYDLLPQASLKSKIKMKTKTNERKKGDTDNE